MTDPEIFHETLVTPRAAYVPLPDLRVVDRPGWLQIITPSFRQGGFNEIAFSAIGAHEDTDAIIDTTIAEYRTLGVRFRWSVPPGSAPADLGGRLAARGLVRSEVWAMAALIDEIELAQTRSTHGANEANHTDRIEHDVTVEAVDDANVDDFTRAMSEGWSVDPSPLDRAHRTILAMPERGHRMYLARVDGTPAATASYVAFPRSAYLLGGVTLPQFRHRGVYRALVAARIADARERGITLATCHARATSSGPLLARRGFRTIARFDSYSG